ISAAAGGTNLVYDNRTGELYQIGSNLQVIGPNNDTVWKTINFPTSPSITGYPAVDWKTNELYVPWENYTSAFNLTTNTLGPTLSLETGPGATPAATFDSTTGMVYVVSDYGTYNVTELNPLSHAWVAHSPSIPSTEYGGIAYASVSDRLL